MNKEVLLISTLHDPRGVFVDCLQSASNKVLENYTGWVINVTNTTDQKVKDVISSFVSHEVYLTEPEPAHPIVSDKVENDHLYLLKETVAIAKELGISKVQYTDGDRMITAASHFPEDLQEVAEKASELLGDKGSYINFRRSIEDYLSHHPPLVQTEFEFNRLYTEVFGMPIDIGSTSHGMSIDVLEEILYRSPQMEAVSFPHPKWLLIAKEMDALVQSVETINVLTFETPDQFKKEVMERINNVPPRYRFPDTSTNPYQKLQQDYMVTLGRDSTLSSNEWSLRFNTERQYLTILKNHLSAFGFTTEREAYLRGEIDRSLNSLEGLHKVTEEALRRSPEEIRNLIQERVKHILSQSSFNP